MASACASLLSNPVKARRAVSNESVGWDQSFKSGGELVDCWIVKTQIRAVGL